MQILEQWPTAIWRAFKNWLQVRGAILGILWMLIGLVGYAAAKRLPTQADEVLEKLHEFGDPWLVVVLAVAAFLVAGVATLVSRNRPSWEFPDRIADELSDTATHFLAISLVLFVWESVDHASIQLRLLWPLVMLIPAISFCPSEKEQLAQTDTGQPERPDSAGSAGAEQEEDYGFRFVYPQEMGLVGETALVRGTAEKEPPAGMEIWLIRRWGNRPWEYYPLERITLRRVPGASSFEWTVTGAYVGGQGGQGETRQFEVWLVGRQGMILVNHYVKWHEYLNRLRRDKNCPGFTLISRAIDGETEDMRLVATLLVQRR